MDSYKSTSGKKSEALTCTRHSYYIAALTDQVVHDGHHSKLIPGLLQKDMIWFLFDSTQHWTVFLFVQKQQQEYIVTFTKIYIFHKKQGLLLSTVADLAVWLFTITN